MRQEPAALLQARSEELRRATKEFAEAGTPVPFLTHAEAHRAVRTGNPLPLQPACVLSLLTGIREPGNWATFLTWSDDASGRLRLDLIPLAPPGYRAPVAALIAYVALQRGAPRTARLAAQQGFEDNISGQNPAVLQVLAKVRSLTQASKDLRARPE